jgi:hypothetical protein
MRVGSARARRSRWRVFRVLVRVGRSTRVRLRGVWLVLVGGVVVAVVVVGG